MLESTTRLIANKSMADKAKRAKIEQLHCCSTAHWRQNHAMKMNVLEPPVSCRLRADSNLSDNNWHAVESVVEEKVVRDIIRCCVRLSRIIELPLSVSTQCPLISSAIKRRLNVGSIKQQNDQA